MRRHLTGPRSAGIAGTLLLVVAAVATVVGLTVVVGAALGIYVVIKRFTAELGAGDGAGPGGTTTRTRGRV